MAPGTGLATSVAPHFGHFIVSISFERLFATAQENSIAANRTCQREGLECKRTSREPPVQIYCIPKKKRWAPPTAPLSWVLFEFAAVSDAAK